MKTDSWLYSDSFLKRAFAVWGYHAVANLIIAIPIFVIWSLLMATVVRNVMQRPEFQGINFDQQGQMQLDVR